jgi:cyclopropane fatty-acyl-phospholipid synthase-like methyltransferase
MDSLLRRLFFNLWYFRRPPWDTGITPPEVNAFISVNPPGRALDMGCGTGTNVITLAKNGWQVVGVDFAAKAIRSARRKANTAGVRAEFRVGDVSRLEGVDGQFDLVLDIGCFHSLTPPAKAAYADQLTRLLAPGGTFLLYTFISQPDETGSGLQPGELQLLTSRFKLAERQDGSDRGRRPSAWLRFVM